jgi:hypothetical protein
MSTTKELLPSSDDWRARVASLGLEDKDWLRTPEAVKYSGFGPAKLYQLMPELKSFVLKRHKNSLRGIRYWSRSAIDAYLTRKYEEALAQGNPVGVVAWAKEKAVS